MSNETLGGPSFFSLGGGLRNATPLANWYQRIENFQFSSQEFYKRVQEKMAERQYPNVTARTVSHHEGGTFTPYREYLRVVRHELDFEICAAPFGVDFFISWWLLEKPGCGCLFFLGPLAAWLRKKTYYQEDTAILFREAIHDVVVAVLTDIMGDKGAERLRALPAPTVAKSPLT